MTSREVPEEPDAFVTDARVAPEDAVSSPLGAEGGVIGEPHAPARRLSRRDQLRARHGRGLRQHAARGTLINTGFMVGISAVGLIRGFLLAAFLTAEDYGVWGILVVSLGTLLWLKSVGIGDKYIQQDDEDQEVAFQKAFTLELAFTAIFMVILAAALPLVVAIHGESEILLPGLVILLLLPAGALSAPLWVYSRDMHFVRARVLQSIDPIVGTMVALGLAIAGAGYWSLAGGVLAGAWTSAIAVMLTSPYKLRLRYDKGTLKSYADFSWPLFVANGASMVIAQSALIATSAEVGIAGVGVLALASNITGFTQRVDQLITGTLYPAICAVKDELTLLHESFAKSNRMALLWAMPFGTALTLFSADLVNFVLGQKWEAAIIVLQFYGLTAAFGHIAYNWDAYMRALGKTKPMAVASAVAMVSFLASLPLLFTYGLKGLAMGAALQGAAHLACRAFYMQRLFAGFAFWSHAFRAILPTVPGAAFVLLARLAESGDRSLPIAVAELAVYCALTIVATWYLEGRLLREAVGYLRKAPAPA